MKFKEIIKKAVTGEVYGELGLTGDPFSVLPEDVISTFINREKEFKQLARAINNLRLKLTPHVVILGSHGIGKTHFLKCVYEILKEEKETIGFSDVILIDGLYDFNLRFIEQSEYAELLMKLNKGERILLLVDDLDIIFNRQQDMASKIIEAFESAVIGTWNPNEWRANKQKRNIRVPKTEVVYLHRLETHHCKGIIEKRIKQKKKEASTEDIFDDKVKNSLCNLSDGNPYRLITYAKRLLNFMMDNNFKICDETVFKGFADEVGLVSVEETKKEIDKLTEKQLQVVSIVIEKREITAQELAELLGFSRPAAVQYLQMLYKKNILESKTKGKSAQVWYYIPTELEYDLIDYMEKKKKESEII